MSRGTPPAQGTNVRHTSTSSAIAAGDVCLSGYSDCSWVDVYIGPGKEGGTTVLCLDVSTGADLYEEGCAEVSGTFVMDTQHLTTATLTPTPVDLYTSVCDDKLCDFVYSRTVMVDATWIATGNRTPIQERLGDPHGSCTEVDMINGFYNPSNVTLAIDGQAVNATGNLQSLDAHQMVRTNCDEEYVN